MDAGDSLYGVQQMVFFLGVLDVCIDQERVSLAVDVFDSDLKAVEASGFRRGNLCGKISGEILVNDPIGCSEEGEDVGNEVTFVGGKAGPVVEVRG